MGALKVVGGILATVGAGLLTVQLILIGMNYGFIPTLFLALILPILALIGGIIALAGKRAGGIIALIVGIIWLTFAILYNLGFSTGLPIEILAILAGALEASFFYWQFSITVWVWLSIEVVLVFAGGILATAGGSD
jgi:hypothetical protein